MKLIEYSCYVGVLCAVLLFLGCAGSLPRDKDVRLLYLSNKSTFQKVIEMLKDDGALDKDADNSKDVRGPSFAQDVVVIDTTSKHITVNLNVSDNRKEEYKRAFETLNISRGAFVYKNTGRVYFIMALRGLVTSGAYKGVAYVPRPADYPSNAIVSSLDEKATSNVDGKYLVPIEGHWYIYYDCTQ